jgi:hypothetical protein
MTKRNISILVIVVCVFALSIIKIIYDKKSLKSNGVFVIGKIERVEGAKGGPRAFISFKYKGKTYYGDFISTSVKKSDTMNRYFFKIDTTQLPTFNYDNSITVPDSIKEAPYGGWDSIPVHVSSQ